MTISEFIEKAIEGGWSMDESLLPQSIKDMGGNLTKATLKFGDPYKIAVLDPKAWQAVGKVEGWRMTYKADDYLRRPQKQVIR